MTITTITHLGQQIADRAKAIAKKRGADTQQFVSLFAREQLVAALFRVDDAGRCALKGGAVVLVDDVVASFARPSRDLDVSLGVADFAELEDLLERAAVDAATHGIEFDWAAPKAVCHDGASVRVSAHIGEMRVHFDLDVEFHGEIVRGMEQRRVSSLVPGMPDLSVWAYPVEATIADKIHAIFRHGEVNGRLGDYYDLWHLTQLPIRSNVLTECLQRSFGRFGHDLPSSSAEMSGLSDEYVYRKAYAWRCMLERCGVVDRAPEHLDDIVERIRIVTDRALRATPLVDAAIGRGREYGYSPS